MQVRDHEDLLGKPLLEVIDHCLLWPAPVEFRSSLAEKRRITARLVDPADPDRRLSLRLRPAADENGWVGALTTEADDGALAITSATLYPHDSAGTLIEPPPADRLAGGVERSLASLPAVLLEWRRGEDGAELTGVSGDVEAVLGRGAESLKRVPDLLFAGADSVSVAKFRRWQVQPLEERRSFAMDFPSAHAATGERRWLRLEAQLDRTGDDDRTVAFVLDVTERKQRELELAAAHDRLRDLLGSVPGAIVRIRVARDGSVFESQLAGGNTGTLLLDGDAVAEAGSEALLERVVWSRDLPDVESAFRRASTSNGGVDIEFRVRDAKGRLRWVRLIAEPTARDKRRAEYTGVITDFSGPKMGMQHLSAVLRSDRDQLRKTAQALKDSERRIRELNDAAPVMTHRTDGKGRIVGVNKAWLDALGYTRDEAVGERAEKFMTEAGFIHLAAAAAGFPAGDGRRGVACELLAKNGRVIETQAFVSVDEDEEGLRRSADFRFVDVTERNHAERALAESQARYRAIVDEQTDLVCRIAADRTLRFGNRAFGAAVARPVDALLGNDWLAILADEDRPAVEHAFDALGPASPRTEVEARLETAAGTRWHRWMLRGFFDAEGRPLQYQAVGRDVHAERTLEADLRAASHREQQRAGRAINDALAGSLKGVFVELTSLAHSLEHAQPELYHRVRSIIDGVDRGIGTLRALHQGLTADGIEADDLVDGLRRLVASTQAVHDVPVSFECEPGLDPGDVALGPDLYRIAQQALIDAARHPETSCIALRLLAGDGEVVIEIEDDGRYVDGRRDESADSRPDAHAAEGRGAAASPAAADDLGLRLMRYRAAAIGASIDVGESERGGTVFRCRIGRHGSEGTTTDG